MAQGPQLLPSDSATCRVLEAVAVTSGGDPLELPPLYDALDPDALDALVTSMSDGNISFTYAGCEVTVDGGNGVEVSAKLKPTTTGRTPDSADIGRYGPRGSQTSDR